VPEGIARGFSADVVGAFVACGGRQLSRAPVIGCSIGPEGIS